MGGHNVAWKGSGGEEEWEWVGSGMELEEEVQRRIGMGGE